LGGSFPSATIGKERLRPRTPIEFLKSCNVKRNEFSVSTEFPVRVIDRRVVLWKILDKARGPSSETYGLLGRVYKDRWEGALKKGETTLARGLLDKAIHAYLKGFETDWRDAYPGINAATLMILRSTPDGRVEQLLPVVRYASSARSPPASRITGITQRCSSSRSSRRTRTQRARQGGGRHSRALEPETTARNLQLIRTAREVQNEAPSYANQIENELKKMAKP